MDTDELAEVLDDYTLEIDGDVISLTHTGCSAVGLGPVTTVNSVLDDIRTHEWDEHQRRFQPALPPL